MTTYRSSRPTSPPDVALANALPELRDAEARLRKNAAQHGIAYVIAEFGGLRTATDTTRALRFRDDDYAVYLRSLPAGKTPTPINTWRPIAPFGESYHNYGGAFDVYVTGVPDGKTQAWGLTMLQNAMPAVGLRSGVSFGDAPHAELPWPLSKVKARWLEVTGGTGAPSAKSGAATVGVILALVALAGLVVVAVTKRHGSA